MSWKVLFIGWNKYNKYLETMIIFEKQKRQVITLTILKFSDIIQNFIDITRISYDWL